MPTPFTRCHSGPAPPPPPPPWTRWGARPRVPRPTPVGRADKMACRARTCARTARECPPHSRVATHISDFAGWPRKRQCAARCGVLERCAGWRAPGVRGACAGSRVTQGGWGRAGHACAGAAGVGVQGGAGGCVRALQHGADAVVGARCGVRAKSGWVRRGVRAVGCAGREGMAARIGWGWGWDSASIGRGGVRLGAGGAGRAVARFRVGATESVPSRLSCRAGGGAWMERGRAVRPPSVGAPCVGGGPGPAGAGVASGWGCDRTRARAGGSRLWISGGEQGCPGHTVWGRAAPRGRAGRRWDGVERGPQ